MKSSKKWLVWLIVTSFFSFQFVLRLFPGLLMQELISQFRISASDFGVLSAAYYLGYSGMQIPLGIFLDRYNPRNILAFCILVCALGVLPFIYSNNWQWLILGRFLIGVGSAAGFLGTAKVIRAFFPESRFTFMIGLSFSLGLLGAVYGGTPTNIMIQQLGWTQVAQLMIYVCLILTGAIFLLFPKGSENIPSTSNEAKSKGDFTLMFESLRELKQYPKVFWIALAGAAMVGPLEGFADVWGISFLVNIYGYTKSEASLITSFIYFGMLFGGPVLSFLVDRYKSFYQVLALCGLFMAGSFMLLLLGGGQISYQVLVLMMTFVGVLCCYQVVVFGLVCRIVPSRLSGLATSVTNCINMVAGSFFHLSMGWIMDYQWTGASQDGIKVYENYSYSSAISVIPVCLVFGFIGFHILKRSSDTSQAVS